MPIAEPLCELEAAVGVTTSRAHLDVRCAKFVERAHHLLDCLVFDPKTVLNREVI